MVKHWLAWGCAWALGCAVGITGWSWLRAQTPATQKPPTIAFLNYAEVMRLCDEAQDIKKLLQGEEQKFFEQLQAKQKEIDETRKQLTTTTDQTQRDALERKLKDLDYQFGNIRSDAQKKLTRLLNERYANLYFKVWNKVKAIADSQGYEVVFRFNEDWRDANKREVYFQPDRVMARLTANNLWPMYYNHQAADITGQVITLLNREYQAATGGQRGNGAGQ
ncbi:MAG: OmpH family outer membrane protein [Gemmatales bacterium]|nr:OmpH family outer membrane protein [Gemmatales bacterium]MCS7160029.1 OmpH family outer membrane protein [Gemmatales bacterium]MDW8175228.1 OmpH family outer membrane protein [Gemmatales bacterium]MDW8222478.1 OmpH family outer membrane protein [Gemmatales bacterium]